MKNVFIVQAQSDGGLKFNSDYHRAMFKDFLKKNVGMRLKIIPDEQIPNNVRRYFEGGIVPFFALQHFVIDPDNKQWCTMPLDEARECLKREFNPTYFRDLSGKIVKGGESTANLNKKEFVAFIDRVTDYFQQNGYEIPNNEEYKNWVDNLPDFDEEYPPVVRLRELAEKRLLELNNYVPTKSISSERSD